MKKIYTILIALITTVVVMAQAPDRMSYQAVLRDAGNNLLTNKSVSMRISVLQGNAFGSAVYVETHSVSTNANGLVTVEIGSGTPLTGTFASINWANGPYFIKTETDPNAGTNYSISGTSQLLSVPYALSAKKAESVSNVKLDDLTDVSAASPSANQVLSWNGSAWSPVTLSGGSGSYFAGTGLTLNGTTFSAQTTTALWNANQLQGRGLSTATPSNGQFLQWNGSVWAPATVSTGSNYTAGTGLDLSGNTFSAQNTSAIWNANQLQGFGLSTATPTTGQTLQWNGSVWAPANVSGGSSQWTTTGSHIYYSTGRVGIGLSTPIHPFHLYGTTTASSGNFNQGALMDITGGTLSNNTYEGLRVNQTSGGSGSNTSIRGIVSGASTQFNVGVFGSSSGSSNINRGVQGGSFANGTYNQGVFGRADGRGDSSGLSENIGVIGYAVNNKDYNYGMASISTNSSGGLSYALYAYGAPIDYAGYFDGDVNITGTLTNPSDMKLKKNVTDMGSSISKLMLLDVKRYEYLSSEQAGINLPRGFQFGFMAQDMERLFPELVKQQIQKRPSMNGEKFDRIEYKAINYIGLVPVLTKAIQEQQTQIDELKKQLEAISLQLKKPEEQK
ncbi:MAG TPA: tail fiber domain-containing protein [Bacteroidia bacterium]|nr:tail fiber domain-containing protein [Bacteroidia bacterium]